VIALLPSMYVPFREIESEKFSVEVEVGCGEN
jgi:hypothetical protein